MYQEQVATFGPTNTLVGIVTTTQEQVNSALATTAVVLLNAGVVHRVGQNRIYVKIARQLAKRGLTCLRFDYSGIGDSPATETTEDHDNRQTQETITALDYLQQKFAIKQFVLIGSCSGAVNAARVAAVDRRVKQVVMLNPACTYGIRFFLRFHCLNKATWKKIILLQIQLKKILTKSWAYLKAWVEQEQHDAQTELMTTEVSLLTSMDIAHLLTHRVKTLLLCAQWDPSLDYCYRLLKQSSTDEQCALIQTSVIPNCDHALYSLSAQGLIVSHIDQWLTDTQNVNVKHLAPYQALRFVKNVIV